MKVVYQHEHTRVIRFDRGEDVLALLRQYCEKNGISAGSFWGIGAAKGVTLAEYDREKKEYKARGLEEMLEIASLTGNISQDEKTNGVILHAHGVFATLQQVYAGHVMRMLVGVTCEVTLAILPGLIRRRLDQNIGLKVLT